MGSFEVLDLSETEKWNRYFNRLPVEQQDIYFTPGYYRLYEQNGEGKVFCFVFISDDDIAIYPFLVNSVNELGFELNHDYFDIQGAYGYNGVITSTYREQFISSFYQSFEQYAREKNILAEFTRFHPLLNNQKFSEKHLSCIFDRKTISIDLTKEYCDIFAGFQTTTRKQVKRATQRYGIEVKWYKNDLNQLDTFESIYHETMERVKSPPYLFFNNQYFHSLIADTDNVCFIAYHNDNPIASILAFYNPWYLHGHLGGARTDALHMSPYGLLYSEMVKFGQSQGCRYLHVGGGTTSKDDDPLFQFKKNFSETTQDFYIGRKIYNRDAYDSVVRQWETRYPEKKETFKSFLLKYRY